MAFDKLELGHGALGAKSVKVTDVPEPITKLVHQAYEYTKEHPGEFHQVTLSNASERDNFHRYGKAAAAAHDPVLDYRKLPRPGQPDHIAFFTLRELTPDTPRPGRKPAEEKAAEEKATEEKAEKAKEPANA